MRFVVLLSALLACSAQAQTTFSPDWFSGDTPYLKIGVTEDGMYALTGAEVQAAGLDLGAWTRRNVTLLKNGRPVPLLVLGGTDGALLLSDTLVFVGERNTGAGEAWAYDAPASQSSPYYSLFSDTTYYWLYAADTPGLRYAPLPTTGAPASASLTVRDTAHVEEETFQYDGDSNDSGNPLYTRGEALFTHRFSLTSAAKQERVFTLPLPRYAKQDSLALRVRLSSGSSSPHRVTLLPEIVEGGAAQFAARDTADWTGYAYVDLSARVAASTALVIPAGWRVRLEHDNTFGGNPNIVYVDFFEVAYTRTLSVGEAQERFTLPAGPARLAMRAGQIGAGALALMPALGQYQRLQPATPSGDTLALAGTLAAPARVFASTTAQLRAPARLARYQAPALAGLEADYIIITRPVLRASAEALAAEKLARQGLKTAIVMQSDVFDQFDYGRPTPHAMQRFIHQSQRGSSPTRYVTLWGDALTLRRTRALAPWEVVTFGNAASDAWMAMQFAGPTDWTEVVSMGRLPVRSNEAGMRFVDKLRAYATADNGRWQRRGLFVSGGYDVREVGTLESYTTRWGGTAALSSAAFDTTRLVKRSLLIVDAVYRERITDELREGASWYAFFGHSSTQIWETIIDPPPTFRNAPFLPAVFTFGCRTGAFTIGSETENTLALAEQLVIESEHGAIAHWGSSELSTIGSGGYLGDALHRIVFDDTVRVLGDAARLAKNELAVLVTSGSGVKNLLQYGLIGDPATDLRIPSAPNLHVGAADLRFSKDDPLVADSTLDVRATVRSWGLVPTDSIDVALYRTAPGGTPVRYDRRLAPFADSATVVFTVPLTDADAGDNRFEVAVDEANTVAEQDELDNRATRQLPVLSGGLALVSPGDYAFVAEGPVLRLTRSSLARDTVGVTFEVDTTDAFASPLLQRHQATAVAFAEWAVPDLRPGTPYYWRARLDGAEMPWTTAAFSVQPTLGYPSGWSQEAEALQRATATGLYQQDGSWFFDPVEVRVQPTSERSNGEFKGQINVGDQSYLTLTLGWGFVVVDGVTGAVRAAVHAPTFRMSASLQDRFGTEEEALARLDALVQSLRVGDVVVGRSRFLGNSSGPVITDRVKALVRALGSTAVDTISYSHLWQMVARVGYPEQRWERVVAPGGTNEVVSDTLLTFRRTTATLTGPPVGPAQVWTAAGSRAQFTPTTTGVLRVRDAATDSVLATLAVNTDAALTGIAAGLHPRLRLQLAVTDTTAYRAGLDDAGRTPAPLPERWYLAYTPVPDVLLDGAAAAVPTAVQEGEAFEASFTVRNLGTVEAAAPVVTFALIDAQNRERVVGRDTLGTLAPGGAAQASVTFSTDGLTGANALRVRVDQQVAGEAVTFNNFYRHPFTVAGDQTAPRYAITIDGEAFPAAPALTDLRDPSFPFVSAQPTIEILIEDDNAFRPLSDSGIVRLTLNGEPIRLGRADVRFEPAKAGERQARVLFTPDLSQRDTTYTLVLRAFDASGNEAADSPYQVHFRVQNTLEIEQVLPYPNPMVGQTTFAFRVKGADAGEISECRLRIYTLTGQVVREFDLIEDPALLDGGALRIGWNKLRWDGTDADGDRLATGVYLYRVFMRGADAKVGVTEVDRIAIIR